MGRHWGRHCRHWSSRPALIVAQQAVGRWGSAGRAVVTAPHVFLFLTQKVLAVIAQDGLRGQAGHLQVGGQGGRARVGPVQLSARGHGAWACAILNKQSVLLRINFQRAGMVRGRVSSAITLSVKVAGCRRLYCGTATGVFSRTARRMFPLASTAQVMGARMLFCV